jgi:hypothetical protein
MPIGRAVVVAALSLWSSVSFAQEVLMVRDQDRDPPPVERGTNREEAACRPDVRRFCSDIPDNAGALFFLACLKENRSKISKACRDVLVSHGQ